MRLEDIVKRLPSESGKAALVSGILLERENGIDSLRSQPIIVVLTDRKMTLNGGNGHDGVDGIDMGNIRQALRAALGAERGSVFVDKFVVRERQLYPSGTYDRI